jgi:hypothetical protein
MPTVAPTIAPTATPLEYIGESTDFTDHAFQFCQGGKILSAAMDAIIVAQYINI